MAASDSPLSAHLYALLENDQGHLLTVGREATEAAHAAGLTPHYEAGVPLPADKLASSGRFRLAVVGQDAASAAVAGNHTLVQPLRDLYAEQVLVALEQPSSPWSRRDLMALGFIARGKATLADGSARDLFAFNIATYKVTPDWLNAEHWAHPELFDRYRW